jgi:5-methylcytosine-specific restriction endonuclease McrA
MDHNCAECGNEFISKSKNKRFCSRKCYSESLKVEKSCVECGEVFKTRHGASFCSNACSAKNRYKDSNVTLACEYCNDEFTRKKSRVRGNKIGNFCGRDCRLAYDKENVGENHYKWNSARFNCKHCGEGFTRQENVSSKRRNHFCSPGCYFSHIHNPTLTDEEREENRKYPAYRVWRKSVFERDDYTCKCCGERGVKLAAHHILNFAEHKDLRVEVDNGITLCEGCHKSFHSIYGVKNNNKQQLNDFIISQQ